MTIAICLKVGDGVVLGTDSASSLIGENNEYFNVYFTAEKTINLVKGLPIGMMTYGLGSLAGLSIGSLARDLRQRLSGADPLHLDWALTQDAYTLEEVADRVYQFFYHELYVGEFDVPDPTPPGVPDPGMAPAADAEPDVPPPAGEFPEGTPGGPVPKFPTLGFTVAGFSADDYYNEVWSIDIGEDGRCAGPVLQMRREDAGTIRFWGQPEALMRLVYGWSEQAFDRLVLAGLTPEIANQLLAARTDLAHPGMPIQDAIELVKYLADVTVGYVRFKTGAPVVAPPIDIAAITRHQGFKWVARKHYYPMELNPPVGG